MKDKIKIILTSILTIVFCVIYFIIVNSISFYAYETYINRYTFRPYVHPDFVTEYTEKEHIERITQKVNERIHKLGWDNSEPLEPHVIDVYIDIVYAFYDRDPEYFLVEFKFNYLNELAHVENMQIIPTDEDYYTQYGYLIGHIRNDKYYVMDVLYNLTIWTSIDGKSAQKYILGKSAYTAAGMRDGIKFYGCGVQAVLIGEDVIRLYDRNSNKYGRSELHNYPVCLGYPKHHSKDVGYSCNIGQKINLKEQKHYMGGNYQLSYKLL